jgi:hypothetical protein
VGIVYVAYPSGGRHSRELIRNELDVKRVARDDDIIADHMSFSYTSFLRFTPFQYLPFCRHPIRLQRKHNQTNLDQWTRL